MRLNLCLYLCLFILASPSFASPQTTPTPKVTINTGTLTGIRLENQNQFAFLGIPYAAPPVSQLRWKPPQPAPHWTGIRQAATFGPACPQLPANWFPTIHWSEDCLFLNIWTPRPTPGAKVPVIVFFHGGSNTQGYSQMVPLGPALASYGVVLVSANYRLGPFGFLAHPALTAESPHHSSGNYGLLDQLEALRWVRENIAAFGGDPTRVTVMGQSAGAVDVCLLMASPLAARLFQRAILQSGDCQSVFNEDIRAPIAYNFISGTGEQSGELLAQELHIGNDTAALSKLRALPADEIVQTWSHHRAIHFDAIVDGWVIPEQPVRIFEEDRHARISVLVGSNADEATVFGHAGPKSLNEYKKYLAADTGPHSEEEFRAYPASADSDVARSYLQLQSDSFAYGASSLAEAMARAGQKAYLYYFTYAETGKRAALGAYHGEELHFLSNTFPADWEQTPYDDTFGNVLRTYWTQFAKTGDPNAPGLPEWPACNEKSEQALELGRTVRPHPLDARILHLGRIMRELLANTPASDAKSVPSKKL